MKNIGIIAALVLLSGCATTRVETHVDPLHRGQTYQAILVDAPNANIEFKQDLLTGLCEEFIDSGVSCYEKDDLFPPTRDWTQEQIDVIVEKHGLDGWLIIGLGSGQQVSEYIGSVYSASANMYGNSMYGSGTSTAIRSFGRQQGYSIVLMDVKSRSKAMVMEANTTGQGLLNITSSAFAGSLVDKIMSEMAGAGFLKL